MTLKIKITHDQPGYPKGAKVQAINVATGKPLMCHPAQVLSPGQSCEVFVHSGQAIRVDEVDLPVSPNGGGGPGDPPVPV